MKKWFLLSFSQGFALQTLVCLRAVDPIETRLAEALPLRTRVCLRTTRNALSKRNELDGWVCEPRAGLGKQKRKLKARTTFAQASCGDACVWAFAMLNNSARERANITTFIMACALGLVLDPTRRGILVLFPESAADLHSGPPPPLRSNTVPS